MPSSTSSTPRRAKTAVADLGLRTPFVSLLFVLFFSVGACAIAGTLAIGRLGHTLDHVVGGDVQRLMLATHIRRLFRSELLILHGRARRPPDAQDISSVENLAALRRERRDKLAKLSSIQLPMDRDAVKTLLEQDRLGDGLATQVSQPWETAIGKILASTEHRLSVEVSETSASAALALTGLWGTTILSLGVALGLGTVVLRRVRNLTLALHDSGEQLRCAIESAPSLLAIVDLDGSLSFLPPQGPEFLGFTLEALKQSPLEWIQATDKSSFDEAFRAARDQRIATQQLCVRAIRSDESEWFASVALTPVHDPRGRTTGVVLQILDVTAQTQGERARLALEEQLRQSQKMESVGRLAGGIAHDFNNLLTAIKGFASLLQEDIPESHPSRDCVDGILGASERAAGLTHQLLAFSRKQVLAPRTVHLGEVVTRMEKLLMRIIGEDVRLEVNIEANLGQCLVDISQVEQIILNLAVNARQAMPSGGRLLIELGTAQLDESYVAKHADAQLGAHVQLTVSDTGTGMTQEVQQHAFEPFFTTKPQGEGTGLGLSVVYGAVRQQKGTVNLYSEVGLGTTFKIYFPCVTTDSIQAPSPGPTRVVQGGDELVLLVEDDPLVRRFSRRALVRLGYTVIDASTAEQALAILQETGQSPQLLITDVVLPGRKGPELAAELRRRLPSLQVLFCSGYSGQLMTQSGQIAPEMDLLQKPYDADTLARRVRRALSRDRLSFIGNLAPK